MRPPRRLSALFAVLACVAAWPVAAPLHALAVDTSTCTLYETWDTQYSSSGSTAGSGAVFPLSSNALRPAGWTSADAAGLPILPGLARYTEVQAGAIRHAIRFTVQHTD